MCNIPFFLNVNRFKKRRQKQTTMYLKTKACFQTATGFSPNGPTAGFV